MFDDDDARELDEETRAHYEATQRLGDEIDRTNNLSSDLHSIVVDRNSYIRSLSQALSDVKNYIVGNRKDLEENTDRLEESNDELEEVHAELESQEKRNSLKWLAGAAATSVGAGVVAAYLDGRKFDLRLAEDDSIGEVLDSGLGSNNPEVERVSGELVESFGNGNYTLVMEDAYLGPNAVGLEKEGELQEVYDVDQQAYDELRQEVKKFT